MLLKKAKSEQVPAGRGIGPSESSGSSTQYGIEAPYRERREGGRGEDKGGLKRKHEDGRDYGQGDDD